MPFGKTAALRNHIAALRKDIVAFRNHIAALRNHIAVLRNDIAAFRNRIAALRNGIASIRKNDKRTGYHLPKGSNTKNVKRGQGTIIWLHYKQQFQPNQSLYSSILFNNNMRR